MKTLLKTMGRSFQATLRQTVFAFALGAAGEVCAATTYYWVGGTGGDWSVTANWNTASDGTGDSGKPVSGDTVIFNNAAEVNTGSGNACSYFTLNADVTLSGAEGQYFNTMSPSDYSSFNTSGSGTLRLNGVKINAGYDSQARVKMQIDTPMEIVAGSENELRLNVPRYTSKANITGAITGGGKLYINGTGDNSPITITGSTSGFTGTMEIGAKTQGTLDMGGGTFKLLNNRAATATLKFSGGVLEIDSSVTTDVSTKITGSESPVVLNSDDSWTWGGTLSGNSGGLTKTGSGTLEFSQSPQYTGVTTISGGALVLPIGHTFPDSVVIADGAEIRFEGDPTWTDGSEQTLCTFAADKVPDAATLSKIKITGLGPRQSCVLDVVSGSLVAMVSAAPLTWNGADNTDWSATDAWLANGSATTFLTNDVVAFTDDDFTAQSADTLTVKIDSDVAPAAVTVSPAANHKYIFTGAGTTTPDGLVVSHTGAGTLNVASDVFHGAILTNAALGAIGFSGDVTLSAISSPSASTANYASVYDNANLTITNGVVDIIHGERAYESLKHSLDIANAGTLTFSGDVIYEPGAYIKGAGDIVLTNNASIFYCYNTGSGGTPYYTENFSGRTIVNAGSTVHFRLRGKGLCSYPGALVMKGGSLAFSHNKANNDDKGANLRAIEVPQGYTGLIDVRSASTIPAHYSTLTGGGILNVDLDTKGFRFAGDSSEFEGTVNFWGIKVQNDASGITKYTAGSAKATFNVMVKPGNTDAYIQYLDVAPTKWLYLEMQSAGQTLNMGAFNVANSNMVVYCKNPFTLALGGESNADSTIEGKFGLQNAGDYGITKSGAGTLTLGKGFQMEDWDVITNNTLTARNYTKSITVNSGTLINNADLTGIAVTVAAGAAIGGNGVYPKNVSILGAYTIKAGYGDDAVNLPFEVDFKNGASLELDLTGFDPADTAAVYTVLTAESIKGKPPASLLDSINEGLTGGKWKFRSSDGVLTLGYEKNGFKVMVQ